jgi:hypothetical protein
MADRIRALIIDDNRRMAPMVERTLAPIGVEADLTTDTV